MPPKPSTAKLSAAVERATPTGAVATTEKKLTLRDVLESRREHVARALPKEAGLTPDRLLVIAETLVTANPALGQCAPRTLLGALMTTAQLGLEPGPLQHVYFVPRWNTRDNQHEVNFQLGYKGMVELARRAGVQIRTREVYANDDFEIIYGLEDQIIHRPTLAGERGDVIGYYLVATWTEHREPRAYVLWMSKDDVDKIRLRSDAGKKEQGPWRTDYDAMSKKTLVRRAFASNSIPTTQLIAQAVNVDDSVRREISAEAIDITPEEHRVEADHAASHAHAALGDGRGLGDDARQADAAQAEPRNAAPAGGTPGDGYRGDHADVLTALDAVPDDEEAIISYLQALTVAELAIIYGEYDIEVPMGETHDADYVHELAARIKERRVTR